VAAFRRNHWPLCLGFRNHAIEFHNLLLNDEQLIATRHGGSFWKNAWTVRRFTGGE
jgi:hypothetical protein